MKNGIAGILIVLFFGTLSAFAEESENLLACTGMDGSAAVNLTMNYSEMTRVPEPPLKGYFDVVVKVADREVYSTNRVVCLDDECFTSGKPELKLRYEGDATIFLSLNAVNFGEYPETPVYENLSLQCVPGTQGISAPPSPGSEPGPALQNGKN